MTVDRNNAIGYVAVGQGYSALAETGRASEYTTKGFQLREHSSEREKPVTAANYYLMSRVNSRKRHRRLPIGENRFQAICQGVADCAKSTV